MGVASSDKYGIRKGPRYAYSDYGDAIAMADVLMDLLTSHSKVLGVKLPSDFPAHISIPERRTKANVNGENIMMYTLYMTRLAYRVLVAAERRKKFVYKIEALPRKTKALYHTEVLTAGGVPTVVVHEDYFRALLWVLFMLKDCCNFAEKRYI